MKNTNILSLKSEVPKEIRIQVYKDAIKILKKGEGICGIGNDLGLCLILPCILWDFEDFEDLTPANQNWYWWDTKIAFPEITKEIIQTIYDCPKHKRNILRIEYIKHFLKELKS